MSIQRQTFNPSVHKKMDKVAMVFDGTGWRFSRAHVVFDMLRFLPEDDRLYHDSVGSFIFVEESIDDDTAYAKLRSLQRERLSHDIEYTKALTAELEKKLSALKEHE